MANNDDITTNQPATVESTTHNDKVIVDQWLAKHTTHSIEDGSSFQIDNRDLLDLIGTKWLSEGIVNLSLALAVKKWKRSNTLIISDINAQRLYQLGVGNDTLTCIQTMCPGLQEKIENPEKRWIVIPCSNGMMQHMDSGKKSQTTTDTAAAPSALTSQALDGEQQSAAEEDMPIIPDPQVESQADTQSNDPNEQPKKDEKTLKKRMEQHRMHWGLLVIDKDEKVARWVDSAVKLKSRTDDPDKLTIRATFAAANAAGKVLSGIDVLLGEENGYPKGGFTTSTLKYTPQVRDNNARGDRDFGACGPFMFAFLEHVFRNASELDHVGLRKMFPRKNRGQLRFNSEESRKDMQRLILPEIEKLKANPFGLSLDVLRILRVPTLEQLQSSYASYSTLKERVPGASTLLLPSGEEVDLVTLAAFRRDQEDNPGLYDEDDDQSEALALFLGMQQSLQPQKTGRNGDDGAGSQDTVVGPTIDIYVGSQLYVNIPLDDKGVWRAWSTSQRPPGYSTVPDFAKLSDRDLSKWLDTGCPGDATARAKLHRGYKKTFLGEPDDNFKSVWSQDKDVFDPNNPAVIALKARPDSQRKFGRMRLMMMQHYEKRTLAGLLAYLAKFKPKTPSSGNHPGGDGNDDTDDQDNDDNDESGGNARPQDKSSGAGEGEGGADQNESGAGQDESGESDPGQNDNGVDSSRPTATDTSQDTNTRPTGGLQGLWDFRTMDIVELQKHITPMIVNDPRARSVKFGDIVAEPNDTTYRAILFVDEQKGHFKYERDLDCEHIWSFDPIVFDQSLRALDWSSNVIRHRMEEHYEKHYEKRCEKSTDIDDISGEMTEIEESEDPQSAYGGDSATTGTKRKHTSGETSPSKKARPSAPASSLVDAQGTVSGAPDGDDNHSSFSSTLSDPSSLSSSGDSDSDSASGKIGNKHARDPKDNGTDGEGGPAKRVRYTSPSGESGADSNNTTDPQANASFASDATEEELTTEIYIGQDAYLLPTSDPSIFIHPCIPNSSWPIGTTTLPSFAHLNPLQTSSWMHLSPEIPLETPQPSPPTTTLAHLHLKFKKTFLHEPAENFTSIWLHDTSAIPSTLTAQLNLITDPLVRAAEIRLHMMRVYEPEMLSRIAPYRMVKQPPSPPKLVLTKATFEGAEAEAEAETFDEGRHGGRGGLRKRKSEKNEEEELLTEKVAWEGRHLVQRKIKGREEGKESKKGVEEDQGCEESE